MLSNYEDYKSKLINKVLLASNQLEVKSYVQNGIKTLQKQVNSEAVMEFIDNVLQSLKEFSPVNQDVQQWANIKTARMCFYQLKYSTHQQGHD